MGNQMPCSQLISFPVCHVLLQNNPSMCGPSAYHQTVCGLCRPVNKDGGISGLKSVCLKYKNKSFSLIEVVKLRCLFTCVRATHNITTTLAHDQNETLHRLSSKRFRSRASKARSTVCICRLRSKRL